MISLETYGWNFYPLHFRQNLNDELKPGRVISIKGFKYMIATERGELEAELSGKLLYSNEAEDLPKVGDWVLLMDYEHMGYIIETLPRVNALVRKNPGTKTEKQVLAANIDFALIMQGLDRDFNIKRLERYLVQILACNITPVVILNKADLVDNPEEYRNEVQKLQRDCSVFLCSTFTGQGVGEISNQVLEKGRTYILVGSSGVGKSSLLNVLLNSSIQQTASTSVSTNKGRHTTTSRELFQLPNGSLVIDTPGMREFGVTSVDDENSEEMFPAIQQFASQCRFSNCSHLNEAGCAVLEALERGELAVEVYESYQKLIREQRRFQIKAEDKKRMAKQVGKMIKEAKDYRKKYKY